MKFFKMPMVFLLLATMITGCTSNVNGPTQRPVLETASPSPTVTESAKPETQLGVTPVGEPQLIAAKLDSPWSIVRLDNDSALISQRNSGTIVELWKGTTRIAAKLSGVVHESEGGLLGLAVLRNGPTTWIYAYYTSQTDNRIVRMELTGPPGNRSLGDPEPILTGLAKAGNHNGGRIAFGPDGKLYATVGDAGEPDRAQDRASLNGKILRINPNGSTPSDNPFPGSLVYSMGHRNPQGLAWDASGQLWASEFGQDTWDEFNQIVAGANYGWPVVEGKAEKEGYVNPVIQWHTDEASPSGLAYIDGTFFMASLRGTRLWVIQSGSFEAADWFTNEYGRLRDVTAGPDGTLWILTNNTDGRGDPTAEDDRLLQVRLQPLAEG